MWMPETPQPRYWKALVFTSLVAVPIAWFTFPFIRIPPLAYCAITAGIIVAAASVIHRMMNDWRASDTMNLETIHKHTTTARNLRVKR